MLADKLVGIEFGASQKNAIEPASRLHIAHELVEEEQEADESVRLLLDRILLGRVIDQEISRMNHEVRLEGDRLNLGCCSLGRLTAALVSPARRVLEGELVQSAEHLFFEGVDLDALELLVGVMGARREVLVGGEPWSLLFDSEVDLVDRGVIV